MSSEVDKEICDSGIEGGNISVKPYSQLQLFFLLRLKRLVDLRQTPRLNEFGLGRNLEIKLLDRAIYSTFMDCIEKKVGDDARTILPQVDKAVRSEQQQV